MGKRFIDTGIFDDDWFMDLTKDGKILWLYFITKCDHAGILRLNPKLCQLQTGIKELELIRDQLGDRIVLIGDQLYFIPKFIEYQYPGFPKSTVNQQSSAIKILEKYGLWDGHKIVTYSKSNSEQLTKSWLTVDQELANSYGNGNGNENGNGNGNGRKEGEKKINIPFEDFWNKYDYKKGKKEDVKAKWLKLHDKDREDIMAYLPGYILSTPDKQFRKHPMTFLNKESWKDELSPSTNRNNKPSVFAEKIRTYDSTEPQTFK